MNKRIAKKRTTKSFYQRVSLRNGLDAVIHVNRRGCAGAWTRQDDEAMQALVQAVHDMQANGQLATRAAHTRETGT